VFKPAAIGELKTYHENSGEDYLVGNIVALYISATG
jgi:hypothetical protein